MNDVKKYIQILTKVTEAARLYMAATSYLDLAGRDPVNYHIMQKYTEPPKISGALLEEVFGREAAGETPERLLEHLVTLYDQIRLYTDHVKQLELFFNEYIPSASNVGSYTSSGDMVTQKMVTDSYELYSAFTELMDLVKKAEYVSTIEKIFYERMTRGKIDTYQVIERYHHDPFSRRLFIYFLSQRIRGADKETVRAIQEELTNLKTKLIGIQIERVPATNTAQALLQVVGVPAAPAAPLAKLAPSIGLPAETGAGDLARLLAASEIGLIYLRSPSPIEYDLSVVARAPAFNPREGISPAFLARTETIRRLDGKSSPAGPPITVTAGKTYYVVEQLREDRYRLLTPWIGEERRVPASVERWTHVPSPIIAGYNQILGDEIVRRVLPTRFQEVERADSRWTALRAQILAKVLPLGADPALVEDKRFYETVIGEIASRIPEIAELGEISEARRSFYYDEILPLYYIEMDNIVQQMKRTATSLYAREYGPRFAELTRADQREELYREMVDDLLATFIGPRVNIFNSLIDKVNVLKFYQSA